MFWPVLIVGTFGALLDLIGLKSIGGWLMDKSFEWEQIYD